MYLKNKLKNIKPKNLEYFSQILKETLKSLQTH